MAYSVSLCSSVGQSPTTRTSYKFSLLTFVLCLGEVQPRPVDDVTPPLGWSSSFSSAFAVPYKTVLMSQLSGVWHIIIIISNCTRGTTVITYKQANKINTDTNTKSAVIEKSAAIKKKKKHVQLMEFNICQNADF